MKIEMYEYGSREICTVQGLHKVIFTDSYILLYYNDTAFKRLPFKNYRFHSVEEE